MLTQLTLKNFVLVDALDISFNAGLTTITGESGAGKSILLNALGLLLGERARTEVIRPGSDKADVSAAFDLSHLPVLKARLTRDELQDEGETECLVRRVVSKQGRSRAFINGIPVTTQYLRELGEHLVDVHGQNEHQRLSDRSVQLALLDDYAGLAKPAAEVAQRYRTWQEARVRLQTLAENEAQAADRRSLLTYQLEELETFNLGEGEFEALETEHKRLSQAHATLASLDKALVSLDELDSLRQSVREIDNIDDTHSDLTSGQATLQSALGLLDDAARDLRHYQDQIVVDPAQLNLVEERLNTAQDLARKHRIDAAQLPAHTEALRAELDGIDADASALTELAEAVETHAQAFAKKARTLSNKRRKAAPKFAAAVAGYMHTLGIKEGGFHLEFGDAQGEQGIDRVEFYVKTNPNFPAGPLTQIASGGEQTRIALSIQIVAAETSALPCLVLDEADVGVGGTTADTVGRILRELGNHTQVICITHAPQVAALGNHHFCVIKEGDNTNIHTLDDGLRIEELARMLAGADITDETRSYAETLLKAAS